MTCRYCRDTGRVCNRCGWNPCLTFADHWSGDRGPTTRACSCELGQRLAELPKDVPNAAQLAASRRLFEQLEKRVDEVGYEQTRAEVEEVLARRRANVL